MTEQEKDALRIESALMTRAIEEAKKERTAIEMTDLSSSAINTALRQIHAPDPNYEIRVTVDDERVNREEIQADGTGMCFYKYRPIIPVSMGVFKPDFGKFPFEKPVVDIDFKSLEPVKKIEKEQIE